MNVIRSQNWDDYTAAQIKAMCEADEKAEFLYYVHDEDYPALMFRAPNYEIEKDYECIKYAVGVYSPTNWFDNIYMII